MKLMYKLKKKREISEKMRNGSYCDNASTLSMCVNRVSKINKKKHY